MILTHPEQYMGTKEASTLWGYHQNTISRWCQAGKIPGAEQIAPCSPWLIPRDTPCPMPPKHKKSIPCL